MHTNKAAKLWEWGFWVNRQLFHCSEGVFRQATGLYPTQCWRRSMSPYDATRPQWFDVPVYNRDEPYLSLEPYPGRRDCKINKKKQCKCNMQKVYPIFTKKQNHNVGMLSMGYRWIKTWSGIRIMSWNFLWTVSLIVMMLTTCYIVEKTECRLTPPYWFTSCSVRYFALKCVSFIQLLPKDVCQGVHVSHMLISHRKCLPFCGCSIEGVKLKDN